MSGWQITFFVMLLAQLVIWVLGGLVEARGTQTSSTQTTIALLIIGAWHLALALVLSAGGFW